MPELKQPWDFVGFTTRTDSEKLYDIELVKQDLLNHFYTRRGELDWNPEYGSIIPFMLFEMQNSNSKRIIEEDVRKVIASDPRISLQALEIIEFEHGYSVNVLVNYLGLNPPVSMQIDFDRINFSEEA